MKYCFDELVGNATTIALLKRSLRRKTFKQTTIFCGPKGTGKSTSAGIAAMALTCEHPKEDGSPCLTCNCCKANMQALQTNGCSSTVRVINLGNVNTVEDLKELIKEVFGFQNSLQNQVYIFEEVHSLKELKNGYNALLAEIDRISPNTYIIMCTTALNDVKEELRSRALKFEFRRLNRSESLLLADKLLATKNVKLSRTSLETIIGYCKGIPREIEKLIDFVTDNSVSEEEIMDFLQYISPTVFVELIESMMNPDLMAMIESLNGIKEIASVNQIIDSMKDFLLNAIFYLALDSSDDFNAGEKNVLKKAFSDKKVLNHVVNLLQDLKRNCSEADFTLTMLKIRTVIQGRKESSVITDCRSTAGRDNIHASKMRQSQSNGMNTSKVQLSPLSLTNLELDKPVMGENSTESVESTESTESVVEDNKHESRDESIPKGLKKLSGMDFFGDR